MTSLPNSSNLQNNGLNKEMDLNHAKNNLQENALSNTPPFSNFSQLKDISNINLSQISGVQNSSSWFKNSLSNIYPLPNYSPLVNIPYENQTQSCEISFSPIPQSNHSDPLPLKQNYSRTCGHLFSMAISNTFLETNASSSSPLQPSYVQPTQEVLTSFLACDENFLDTLGETIHFTENGNNFPDASKSSCPSPLSNETFSNDALPLTNSPVHQHSLKKLKSIDNRLSSITNENNNYQFKCQVIFFVDKDKINNFPLLSIINYFNYKLKTEIPENHTRKFKIKLRVIRDNFYSQNMAIKKKQIEEVDEWLKNKQEPNWHHFIKLAFPPLLEFLPQ
jgi:hypothetical protein